MGLLKRFFGNHESPRADAGAPKANSMDLPPAIAAAILNEIDLDTAIAVHEGWKRQLQNHLNGQPDDNFCQEIVCLDDQCDLGQWLHGPATERLGQYPLFSVLIARHKYFHEQAGTVLALAHAGKREDALKVMEGGYRHASVQVILQLKALKRGLRR